MIKVATKEDLDNLTQLALLLFPQSSYTELYYEFLELLDDKTAKIFLQYEQDLPIGFAQCQLRYDYVEGTSTSPVGYLEAIYIKADYRRRGYARELLKACENFAREKGCTEFASDCELTNKLSYKFHMAMDFKEANRIICFTKKL